MPAAAAAASKSASGTSAGSLPGVGAVDSINNTLNRTASTLRDGESKRLSQDIDTIGKEKAIFDDAMSKNIDRQIENLR